MSQQPTLQTYRTLIVLWITQCFGQSAAPVVLLLGGIVGAAIAPSKNLSTLPVAMMIVGTATAAMPAAWIMSRIGRKAGFMLGILVALAGALLAAWSAGNGHFSWFCLAIFMMGTNAAFIQQYRFAVAESVDMQLVPPALSVLMLAGIIAGVFGPEMAKQLSHVEGMPAFSAAFIGVAVLLCCSLASVTFYRNQAFQLEGGDGDARPLATIFAQPRLILAITAAVVGWTMMSLVMTATPVSMHEFDHHSLDDTTWVVQSHILAMYVPSFFSGFLVARFGAVRIIKAGILIMAGCIAAGYGRPELMHYWVAMVLLGIGWNFLFLGGTTLLTLTYRSAERFRVQGLNDFVVFVMQAFASLGSGVLLASVGWNGVVLFCLPWLAGVILVLILVSNRLEGSGEAHA